MARARHKRHSKRSKKFFGMIRNWSKNKTLLVGGGLVLAVGAAVLILSGKKSGIGPFDKSLQSIGEYTHTYGQSENIPVLGGVIDQVGGIYSGLGGGPMTTADAVPPKLTPTAAAAEGGADRFTSFSNAYFGRRRSYAGRKTNDVVDRLTVS